jgi:hypothetical protein
MEDPDSLSKQCDVNDFIEKTVRMPYFGKLNFCRKKQRIELESLEQTLREELTKHCRVKIQASN